VPSTCCQWQEGREHYIVMITYSSLCLIGRVGGGILLGDGGAGLTLADERSLQVMTVSLMFVSEFNN
jgi:hypothetical protein